MQTALKQELLTAMKQAGLSTADCERALVVGQDLEQTFAGSHSFPGWDKISSHDLSVYLSLRQRQQRRGQLGADLTALDNLGVALVDQQLQKKNPFDLAALFAVYLRSERQLSAATVKGYENDLKMMRRFLSQQRSWQGWLAINRDDIQAYLNSRRQQHRQRTTISRELASLRGFYDFLLTNKLVADNPFAQIHLKSHPRDLPRYFYSQEMQALFKAADGKGRPLDFRNRALLEMLYATGMRVSECANLRRSQIDEDLSLILVHGKGDKERYVPYGRYAKEALHRYYQQCREPLMQKYHQDHDYVFINQYGQKLSPEGIEYILNRVIQVSSLNSDIHPHMLRHSFATAMLNNGADIRTVQELLGHASLSTTQIYTHVTRESLQDSYFKFFPRAKENSSNETKEHPHHD